MIDLADLQFHYPPERQFVLRVADLHIARGQHVALIGPSGSGKTTLLYLLAGILRPDRGAITIDGARMDGLSDAARRRFRCTRIGMVFQEFELIEYLDVWDNILLTYRLHHALRLTPEVRARARGLAASVQIGDKLRRSVLRLSQGEKQRVAICRALLPRPGLILADEPTGNLDPHHKQLVLDILLEQAAAVGATLVTVTHDHALLPRFDRVIDVADFPQRISGGPVGMRNSG